MIRKEKKSERGCRQCCQLSQIIRETPVFGPYLLVSRFEDEICWTIAKVCHFSRLQVNQKISTILLCLSYFTVNIEHFLINSGMLFVILAYNVNGGKSTFCNKELEKLVHLLWSCSKVTTFWNSLIQQLTLSQIIPQNYKINISTGFALTPDTSIKAIIK